MSISTTACVGCGGIGRIQRGRTGRRQTGRTDHGEEAAENLRGSVVACREGSSTDDAQSVPWRRGGKSQPREVAIFAMLDSTAARVLRKAAVATASYRSSHVTATCDSSQFLLALVLVAGIPKPQRARQRLLRCCEAGVLMNNLQARFQVRMHGTTLPSFVGGGGFGNGTFQTSTICSWSLPGLPSTRCPWLEGCCFQLH